MKGVVNNVKIMFICIVFDGDECDKDVVVVIVYVVDNGVFVINMSFGKGVFLCKDVVDEVVCYVFKNDVFFVYVVGNDGKEVINENNFLIDCFEKCGFLNFFGLKYVDNWIEVGVFNWKMGEVFVVLFFNYSFEYVDFFVLGMFIYFIMLDNGYEDL